jgi:hypothetical protein
MTGSGAKLPPWIRLVYDSAAIPVYAGERIHSPEQLSLPLPEPDSVMVIHVPEFEFRSFRRALMNIKPKWVFDIRAAPRMDRLAGGRSHAFREFDKIGAVYIDLFGVLGISNYRNVAINPAFWTPVVEGFLSRFDNVSGPYFALLDDDLMINAVSRHFASSISHVTGRGVSLSRLSADTPEVLEA